MYNCVRTFDHFMLKATKQMPPCYLNNKCDMQMLCCTAWKGNKNIKNKPCELLIPKQKPLVIQWMSHLKNRQIIESIVWKLVTRVVFLQKQQAGWLIGANPGEMLMCKRRLNTPRHTRTHTMLSRRMTLSGSGDKKRETFLLNVFFF